MHRAIIASVALLAGLLVSNAAHATPGVPDAIQQYLGTPGPPPCSICHVDGVTQAGTVNTPFGIAMRQRGLVPYDVNSLHAALDQMAADRVDSNGNGVTDIDELKAGKDPNAGAPSVKQPVYGCVGSVARHAPSPGEPLSGFLFVVAAAALFAMRRRIRMSRGPFE